MRVSIVHVIHEAFGLKWPMPPSTESALAFAHACAELTELRQLCVSCEDEAVALEDAGAAMLRARIRPVAWDRAQELFVEALRVYARASSASHPARPVFEDIL